MAKTKIMLVEDEIIVSMALRSGLEDLGYEVCRATSSGEESLEIVEYEKPDIVIMDIGLQGKMGGIEAARQIKDRFGVPIIYITGFVNEEIKARTEVTEPYEYLVKPVQSYDINNAIEAVLQKQKSKNEAKREQTEI